MVPIPPQSRALGRSVGIDPCVRFTRRGALSCHPFPGALTLLLGTFVRSIRPIRRPASAAAAVAFFHVPGLTTPSLAQRGPDRIADVAEKVIDAVVNISTSQTVAARGAQQAQPQLPHGSPFEDFFDEFFNRRGPQGGDTASRASARRAASTRSAPASSSTPPASSSPTTTSSPTPTRSPSSSTTARRSRPSSSAATRRPISRCCGSSPTSRSRRCSSATPTSCGSATG